MAKGKQVVEEKLGVNIEEAMATPEGLLKLKQLEVDHEEFLLTHAIENRKLDLQEFQAEVADRDSARNMQEAALLQADVMAKRFIYYFSWFWSGFSALYMLFVTFFPIPEKNLRFADMFSGFLLGTIIAGIITYFYGSTFASRGKDRTIRALIDEKKGQS